MDHVTWHQPALEYPAPAGIVKTCTKCGQSKPLTDFNKHPHGRSGRLSRCRDCVCESKRAAYAANRDDRLEKQREMRAAGKWGIMRRPPRTEPSVGDKTCSKCAETKPHTGFNRNSAEIDGLQRICRECERLRHRNYYLENRDEILAATREANAANPEKNRAKVRRWQKANPTRAAMSQKAWRVANIELVRQWGREFAQRHPERVLHNTRRQRARRKAAPSLPFTIEQLEARLSMFPGCWMCGGPVEAVDHMKPLAKGGWHALMNLRGICKFDNESKGAYWAGARATHITLRARAAQRQHVTA